MLNRQHRVTFTVTTSAADTLSELLTHHQITQQDFAERIGVSQKHVSQLLSRQKFLSPSLAKRVEIVTGLPAKMLLKMDMEYKLANEVDEAVSSSEKFLQAYQWVV